MNDGIGKIWDDVFDVSTGSVVRIPVQFGNDTGLKRYLKITTDAIKGGTPLINGVRYYFAVTAYGYNEDPEAVPNNLENPLSVITIIPKALNPGYSIGEGAEDEVGINHTGLSDGKVTIKVIDPEAVTGDDYEVYFDEQTYQRDANGRWNPVGGSLNKTMDITGSTVDIAAIYGETVGTIELSCHLSLVGDGDWVDGITLTIPDGVTIVEVPQFEAGGGTVIPEIDGNVIRMGLTNAELTTDGVFHGGEDWLVILNTFDPPISIDYQIHDDGWAGNPVDAIGSAPIDDIGFATRTEQHWNLRNVTTSTILLEDQTVINGVDLYTGEWYGLDAAPIIEGFQISVNVNYSAPTSIGRVELNGEEVVKDASGDFVSSDERYDILDYTAFGEPNGTANNKEGYGSLLVEDLQQDYEFRFTGERDSVETNGQLIYITKEGTGSLATMYGSRQYDLGDHPLNPNPGSDDPFLVRVPFEVWNIDKGIQVNYQIYDRGNDPDELAADGFQVWITDDRMYAEVLNTPYVEEVANPDVDGPNYTWNHSWFASDWQTGDTLRIYYDNPIILGTDTYKFNTTELMYSASKAKEDVKKINVFPNPYYAVNSEEINKYNRFVTFTHLPKKAKVRIFNLAGVLVKTIDKDDQDQFLRWDLANKYGLPVASGLYIAHIEMPEIGKDKILKFTIIQEQQILDRF